MKIAFTISDFAAAANIGGDVERETHIVDVPDDLIPPEVIKAFDGKERGVKWHTLSLSLVKEVAS